jgi:glycosyltransferase involved in cell wall biosynthesis
MPERQSSDGGASDSTPIHAETSAAGTRATPEAVTPTLRDAQTQPLVTIGIPTYNRVTGYFPGALASALAQDYPRLEIVVCDNASTDGTEAFMRGQTDPRIRYVRHPKNVGPNANFNACLTNARGTYFLLLHDDDLIDPDFVSSCVAALREDHDVGLVRTGARVIDGAGRIVAASRAAVDGSGTSDLLRAWFARKTPFYLAATLFHTEHLRSVGAFGSPHGLYQDVKAMVQVMARYGRRDVDAPKASFRRHDANNGTANSALSWGEDALHLLGVIADELPEDAPELRRLGLPYFCRKCYRNASAIPNVAERWRVYRRLYRMFERSASPTAFEARRLWFRARGRGGRWLRGVGVRSARSKADGRTPA